MAVSKLMRIKVIFNRYRFNSKCFVNNLQQYLNISKEYNCELTIPITANTLNRNKLDFLKNFTTAIHGYQHIDYAQQKLEKIEKDLYKAIKTFSKLGLSPTGFRAPYLRWNSNHTNLLEKTGFLWDSSNAVFWNILNKDEYNNSKWQSYQNILAFYSAQSAVVFPSLPYFIGNLVEIPVSVPDDEALIDRLRITDKNKIGSIWTGILDKTYERGEIFTLQLHPERIFLCDKALEMVLFQAKKKNPPVWIAQLGEIAKWWKEKDKFEAEIQQKSKNEYQVNLSCSDRATVLIKNLDIQNAANALNAHNETNETDQTDQIDENWYGSYRVVNQKNFAVKSNCRPVIGIAPGSSPELISFLKQDGYMIEVNDKKSDYGIYLEGITEFPPERKLEIINKIENTDAPLVRFWRWPNKARNALSITGDIDAITIWDFILRLFGR